MTIQINKSDSNYKDSINLEHDFYNYPVTVEINDTKYILPFGSNDTLYTQLVNDEMLYIVGENSGLGYISLVLIDHDNGNIIQDVFIDSVGEVEILQGIFDKDTEDQINILSNWFE